MSLTVSDSGGGDFVLVPEGTYIARCVRVIDLGLQPGSPQYPDPKHKVLFAWEIPGETIEINGEEKPAMVMSRYTASLHAKSKLRADLESWRGRAFTADEQKGFQLKAVLDVPCMITIIHSDDGKYANVKSIAKMPKGIPCPPRINDLILYEQENGHDAAYHALSEKLRATVDAGRAPAEPPRSPARYEAPNDAPMRKGEQLRQTVAAMPVTTPADYYTDSDIPF